MMFQCDVSPMVAEVISKHELDCGELVAADGSLTCGCDDTQVLVVNFHGDNVAGDGKHVSAFLLYLTRLNWEHSG